MKTNRKVTTRRNSDKAPKGKDRNPKTMPEPSAAERKGADEKLLASETRYRRLFETAKDGIIILDGDTGEIVDVNPFLVEMLGYLHTEFLGKKLWEIGLFKDIVASKNSFLKLQEERYIRYENLPLETKDEHTIWVEFVSNAYDVNGKQVIQCNIRNITDRKEAEEALHASETRYRLLVEASPDAVTQTDANGKILMCNMQTAILLGYEHPDELIGQSVFGLFPPDELERATANMRKTLEDGIIRNVEYRLVKKDGSQFPVELSAALIRDAAGKPVAFMALTHDITKRKRVEKVVAGERNLLLTLINNLPDRIYVKDVQGRKTISNTADWQTLGEKRMEDIIGKTDFDTYPAELATQYWADDKMVLDSGKPVINREEPNLDWQDNLTWTLTTKVPLRDDNGQVVGLVGIGRDFTERRQVEELLRENEAMYRLLFDSAPMGILLVDTQGKILEVNPAALQILGSPSAEATKEINLLTFQPLIEAGISADFKKGIDSAQPAIAEYPYTTKWGKSVFIILRYMPLFGANGNLEQIQIIMEDITERKQGEELQTRLAAIVESSQDAIFSNSLEGIITSWNHGAERIYGYRADEILGKSIAVFFPPENLTELDALLKHLQRGETIRQFEAMRVRKDGTRIDLALTISPLTDQNGTPLGASVIARDITERKQAEAKIQQQLHRLSALRDIDLVINSNFDLQVTLNILLGHVTAQLGVDAAAVLLFRQSMNELEFAAGRGFHSSNITRLRLKLGEGHPGKAALERRTIAIENPAKSQEPFDTKFIEGEGFATFFAVPLIAKGKVKGVLEVFHRSPFKPDADWLNFLEALAGQAAIAIDNSQLFGNLQQSNLELQLAYDKTIEGWSRALDLRDKETEGHTQRVTKAALRLAGAMGLGNDELIQVRRGALLHDIGKMGVPDHILLKPGDLTEEELAAMRKHPQFAFDLFSSIDFLRPALDIPYCHHEKWDGTGYPRGLKGEQIPLMARIFAVVDVYDAVTSDRPYRVAWTKEKALEYIQSEAGKYFDPNVVQKFIEMIKKD